MDGTLFDRFTRESPTRRLRLISYEYACTKVPRIVILLKQQKLTIHTWGNREGHNAVTLWRPLHPEDYYVLLREDFEIIKQIALDSSLRIFGSDIRQDVEDRILARVKVEFSDRKDF